MDLQILNTLTESQLYRSNGMGKNLKSDTVSELLYLNTLALSLMIQDRAQHNTAKQYAKKTTNYGNYLLFRNSATDLYTLAHQVRYPNTKSLSLSDKQKGVDYLESLNFADKAHFIVLQRISQGDRNILQTLSAYLVRLERQLAVPARLRSLRREVLNWKDSSQNNRERTVAKIADEMRRKGKTGDLLRSLQNMSKYKQFDNPEKSGVLKRAAIAGAGAVAGASLGRKIATKMDKDPDKYSKAGAGIGALAGYWAGKR